jgi:hypothetical protein
LDYAPPSVPGLLVGASAYLGDAGQNLRFAGRKASVNTQLYDVHLQYQYRGLELRALGVYGHIDNSALLTRAKGEAIGKDNYGFYAEAAYDIMPYLFKDSTQYLSPFVRYEQYDTLASVADQFKSLREAADVGRTRIYQGGLTYKPIPNIAIKADYRNIQSVRGNPADEFNLGLGFIY